MEMVAKSYIIMSYIHNNNKNNIVKTDMKSFKLICLLVLIVTFVSCNKSRKPYISDKYYNVKVEFLKTKKAKSFEAFTREYGYNFKTVYPRRFDKEYPGRFMYTNDAANHYFSNDTLEIEFEREIMEWTSGSFRRPQSPKKTMKYIIGIRSIKNQCYAFYIEWTNRPNPNIPSSIPDHIMYEWEIGKNTDLLYTNLSMNIIKSLYPDFRGKIEKSSFEKIILDYSEYEPYSIDFFKEIKFESVSTSDTSYYM